jgi:acyl-CoA thioester hydrolase
VSAPDRPASPEGSAGELPVTYRGIVYPWHCDHMGHMNVMWYVGKFDEATWHLFFHLGLTPSWLRQNNRGMAAVEQTIQYKRELVAGDLITIRSAVLEVRDKSIRFSHEMRKEDSGELAASTILVGVHLDTLARRACALPPHISKRARAMIAA